MNSTPSHVAAVAYEVRTGTGSTLARSLDADMAQDDADMYARQGYRTYVTFVELIDGVWTAPED